MKERKKRLNYNINFSEHIEYIKNSIIASANIKYIYLFGSFAYGNPDEFSDIDIYIVVSDNNKSLSLIYSDIMSKLRLKNIYHVDLIMYSEESFIKRKEFSLEKKIINEGKLLYEN